MPQLVVAFLAFASVVAVADVRGWGTGAHGIVYALLWFCLASSWFGRRGWDRIFFLACLASIGVGVMALAQAFFVPRPFGPFSSANVLGGYAAMHFGIACLARYRRVPWWNEAEVWFYLVAATLNVAVVFLSQSRGALLGLISAILIIAGRRYPKIIGVLAVAAASLIVCWSLQRGLDDPRLGIWRLAFIGAMERPWLGWGQGGLLLTLSGAQSVYNVALEWFVNAGVCGLAAAAWVYVAAILAALKLGKEVVPVAGSIPPTGDVTKAAGRAVLAVLAAFFVQGMFMFGTAATYLPLVTVMAWLASETWDVVDRPRRVENLEPLLDGRVRADRANRG